ncbi:MAG: FAD:protein FMN transferase [Pseudomonadota bacterium]
MPFILAACKPGQEVLRLSGQTMGTTYSIVAINDAGGLSEREVSGAVDAALREVDIKMSNWNPDSEVARFNAGTDMSPVSVSPELSGVLSVAEEVYRASDGRFDTTVGPLIELWGFGAPGATSLPSDNEVADAMGRSGHSRVISVAPNYVQKRQPEAQVYLAAIGKGYGTDHVGRALEALGLGNYMVEIGGEIYAAGTNPDGMPWQIGIEIPSDRNGGVYDVVGLSGLGLASSGDYRNYFEVNGQRFSHVIDPVTGHPIMHKTASATVLAGNTMLADAWSTAMLILGRDRGLEIADAHGIAVLFIDRGRGDADTGFTSVSSRAFDELTA